MTMKNMKSLTTAAVVALMLVGCATKGLCPISGADLESMGGSFVVDYNGTKVKLCCEGCKEDFDADPAKILKILAGELPYPTPEE
jgi:YHS domain-containing protein|tara:strand:+ start:170 stop:424 length:255 start_codon:yes stop_codon:yes gene_type:complete